VIFRCFRELVKVIRKPPFPTNTESASSRYLWRRIAATSRLESSGGRSTIRCGSTRPSVIEARRSTKGAAVTLNSVSVFSGLPQSDPNPTRVGSQDVAGRRRVAESILRSPFSQERTRTPREKPAYPLTPTYPIAGETDWIITVVELSKVISDPG